MIFIVYFLEYFRLIYNVFRKLFYKNSFAIASQAKNSRLNSAQLFLISFFLSPLVGLIFMIKTKKRFSYYVYQYKCPRCKYYFTENYKICSHYEKDGYKIELKEVKKIMT